MIIRVLIASSGFSLGFGLMFFLISLPFLGISTINSIKSFVSIIGGIILIIVGLLLLEIIKIPFLNRYFKFFEYRAGDTKKSNPFSIFGSSILVGMSFSSGWAPCIGPVLLGIISLLSNQQNFLSGIIMLIFVTLGLISSFIALSLIVIIFGNIMNKLSKFSLFLERIMGVLFILLGLMILFSKTSILLSLGIGTDLLEKFNYQITTFSFTTMLISYLAGIFLFLSPCTLPLVIPYLFYLTGIAIRK